MGTAPPNLGERRGDMASVLQNPALPPAESGFQRELCDVLVFHYRSRRLPVSLGEYKY